MLFRVGFWMVLFVKISSQRLSPILQKSSWLILKMNIVYWLTIIAQELAMSKYQIIYSQEGGTQTIICNSRKIQMLKIVCCLTIRNKQINMQRVVLCIMAASPIYLKTPIMNFFDFNRHAQHFPFVVSSFWKLDRSDTKSSWGCWISGLKLL